MLSLLTALIVSALPLAAPAQGEPLAVFLTEAEQPAKAYFRLPRLTPLAVEARVRGLVILETYLTPRGTVRTTRVLKGLPLGLNAVAQKAVESWIFEPVRIEGRAVPARIHLRVPFVEPPMFVRKGNQPRPTTPIAAKLPELARQAGIEGDVVLRVVTDGSGTVIEVEVVKGLPLGLSQAAERAVRSARFQPVVSPERGPVSVEFHQTVRFRP